MKRLVIGMIVLCLALVAEGISAREKLKRKQADLIVANDVSDASIGFDSDQNEVLVIARKGDATRLARAPKLAIANRILDLVLQQLHG